MEPNPFGPPTIFVNTSFSMTSWGTIFQDDPWFGVQPSFSLPSRGDVTNNKAKEEYMELFL
jgi:hypothetical protein